MPTVEKNLLHSAFEQEIMHADSGFICNLATPKFDEILNIDRIREGLRANLVSFPSQVPTFAKHDRPDVQRKAVQLYFVLGWSTERIGWRFGLSRTRIQQILNTWMVRAVELGYIQAVPPAESMAPGMGRPPIVVVLSAVVKNSCAPIVRFLELVSAAPRRLTVKRFASRKEVRKGPRPRRKLELPEIALVLGQIQAGKKVAEMASEVGVSTACIYRWKVQHQRQRDHLQGSGHFI
jgi:transposase